MQKLDTKFIFLSMINFILMVIVVTFLSYFWTDYYNAQLINSYFMNKGMKQECIQGLTENMIMENNSKYYWNE
ncbi:hypothetical protein GIX45_16015 [Erwinia sp. CPCC 100877]|nr:hypothetical protein [Erwinia sp. CPCC 100877]